MNRALAIGENDRFRRSFHDRPIERRFGTPWIVSGHD
jgi:hypothetical protein